MQSAVYKWFLACRPKTLSGAIIPVLVASACAYSDNILNWQISLLCILFACGMQISSNLINDLFDYLKGSDREDRLGPKRACAQGWISVSAMKKGIVLSILLSSIIGLGILFLSSSYVKYRGTELVAVGVLCIIFAYLYTSILSYKGAGDILVLIFFGIVPVCLTYYVQNSSINISVFLLSLVCGIVTDALLVINNYRDREQDAISGKKTTVVVFGEKFGRYHYFLCGVIPVLLIFSIPALAYFKVIGTPYFTITQALSVSVVYLLFHFFTWRKMVRIFKGKELNIILADTSRNMLILGILLTLIIIYK